MAQQGVQLYQEQFCCSICLDLLKDPVTVPCGHNYCRRCIEGFWNQDDQRGRWDSCPLCRQTFIPRPVLKTNTMLAEVVESLKKTRLPAVPPDHCYAGPGDVACDVCTGRKRKAVKTCLRCLVSYCDTHLQPHYQSPAFKKHKLVNASSELQKNLCSVEDILTAEGTNVSETVNMAVSLSTPPEPKTRADFLQYSRPITLDPNTAHKHLSLSRGNRKVTKDFKNLSIPDHPERFTEECQVLSREGLTGRCYWEVELSGVRVPIAVSYKANSRTVSGDEMAFGSNFKSWCLECSNYGYYTFRHSGIATVIQGAVSSRVGVYLDHRAGTLSFYNVSDPMTLIHTVHTTFTHNLHVGFGPLLCGATAELCDLK